MSNWIARLPYAQRYITKTWFEGAEADLDVPETIVATETLTLSPRYSRWSTGRYFERLQSYYYEVSVGLELERYDRFAVGYTANIDTILYGNDGVISEGRKISDDQSHASIVPYDVGDVVGCGYESPSRFFFTWNGIYLGHCIAQLESNALRPEARTLEFTLGFDKSINCGCRPFTFDIEGHFDKRFARSRRLAATVPLEILETVLQFALLHQGINHLPVLHLSRVCRRWRTVFLRSIVDLSILTRKDAEDLIEILRSRIPIHARSVNTEESSDETWMHRFLASPILHIKSTSTLAIRALVGRLFVERAPSSLSGRIPSILRRTFAEVHTLQLSKYSFPTWIRFAQVVFSFQKLETLVCSSVKWETSPITPPTWLTFSKRLRHASFEDMPVGGQSIAGSFWLFLAGRPRQPSDDLVLIPSDISTIGELASSIFQPNFTLVYDRKQDQPRICTLSLAEHSQFFTTPGMSFELEGNGTTYQLARIHACLLWRLPIHWSDTAYQQIGRYSGALSNADSCRFCFEVSGQKGHSEGPFLRRAVAKAMMRQHSAGLLECKWDGKAIEDMKGVQWLKTDAVATFGVEKTYQRGTSGQLTWDVDALQPCFRFETIPWLKLYRHDDQITDDHFIADVAFNINARSGQAEFLLPDSAAPGRYFIVVGDYIYRTESFEIVE